MPDWCNTIELVSWLSISYLHVCISENDQLSMRYMILFKVLAYVTAYVILSGLRALIMHSLCREFLFFHSPGNFSFSGHSLSVNFFQRLAEPYSKRTYMISIAQA